MTNNKKHIVDIVFILVVFAMFAVLSSLVVVLGINAYKNSVSTYEKNYNQRTSLMYIMEKIHQNDEETSIRVSTFENDNALIFTEVISGKSYETWIFVSEGKLKEALIPKRNELKSTDGQIIMELSSLTITKGEKTITITTTDTNNISSFVTLSPKTGFVWEVE